MQKEVIQKQLDNLANHCLHSDKYQAYTDKDLINSSIIFSNILIDVIFSTNQDLTQKGIEDLAETTGKAIRELIRASTSKDMHVLVKSK